MTEQLMTITGLEFTENGRIIARGTVIREGEYDLPALLAAGDAPKTDWLTSLRRLVAAR